MAPETRTPDLKISRNKSSVVSKARVGMSCMEFQILNAVERGVGRGL